MTSQPKYGLPGPFIGIILAICALPFFLNLLGQTRIASPSPFGVDANTLLTAVIFLLLAGAFAKASGRRTYLLIGIMLFCAGVLGSLQLMSTASTNGEFTPATAPRLIASVICQVTAALLIILATATLLYRQTLATKRNMALVIGTSVIAILTAVAAVLSLGQFQNSTTTAPPPQPLAAPVRLIPFLLFLVAGLGFAPRAFRRTRTLFGSTLMISFIPHAGALLALALNLNTPSGPMSTAVALLRWFAYLVPLSGLCLDYFHAYYAQGVKSERAFLRRVVDAIPHYIFTRDTAGYYTLVNKAAAEFYGKSVAEIEGQHINSIHSVPEESDYFLSQDRKALELGQTFELKNHKVTDYQGHEHWLNTLRTPMPATHEEDAQVISVSIDVSARLKAEKALRAAEEEREFRLQVERTIAAISSIFMNLPVGEADAGIDKILRIIGEFEGVDRCYVFRMNEERTAVVNSHEWCADGIESLAEPLRILPDGSQPWIMSQLENNEVVNVPRVDALPVEAEIEKQRWQDQGIQSLLVVPINYGGSRLGSLGLDSIRKVREWRPEEIGLLRSVAELLLNAWTRQKAEAELKKVNRQLEDIIEFLPDPTFVIDRDKKVIAWNRAIERMSGIKKEDMIGEDDYAYAIPFYQERRPILIDLLDQYDPVTEARYDYVERDGRNVRGEVFVPSLNNGEGAHVWAMASPLLDEKEQVIGAIESVRDITERKRAETALRESEERHRLLIETMNDGLGIVDADGLVTYFNDQFLKMMGRQRDEVLGRHLSEFVDENGKDTLREQHLKRRHGNRESYEITFIRKDGSTLPTIVSPAPLFGANGQFQGSFAIVVDITDIERTKDELLRAKEAAEASNRAKSEFLANMSHEIRTPMNCIIGLSDLLQDMDPTAEQERYLEMVHHSGQALLALINDILDLSKIEAGQLKLEPIETDLQQLVEEVADLLAFHAQGRGLELICRYDPTAPHRVECDVNSGPCSAALSNGTVTLDINPKPVKAMQDLTFTLTLALGEVAGTPYIDLGMPGMNMGRNRVVLQPAGESVFQGKGVIVRCPSARRTWKAVVTVPERGSVEFVFDVIY